LGSEVLLFAPSSPDQSYCMSSFHSASGSIFLRKHKFISVSEKVSIMAHLNIREKVNKGIQIFFISLSVKINAGVHMD
jgi:hypothetical protein